MKASSMVSATAIGTIMVVGVSYLMFGIVRVDWLARQTNITMTLPNSAGLVPRSPVLLTGVKVGKVTAVDNTATGVRIDFEVDDRYRIPVAATARIESMSGLGEPYLEFTPPRGAAAPYLEDGQSVDAAAVRVPPSIPEFAQAVTDLMNQIDPQAVESIISTFATGLHGTDTLVPQLARSTDLLAATLLSRTDLLRQLLVDLQVRAPDMTWAEPAMIAAAGPWGDFGPKVSEVAASIARVIRVGNMPDDYTTGTGLLPFLDQLCDYLRSITAELVQLQPVLAPLVTVATDAVEPLDISALITQALHTTSDSDALRLQVTVK